MCSEPVADTALTVVVLTQDEERNIERCLRSVPPGIPCLVVDSGSGDRTVSLAEQRGARVLHRPFDSFAGQRNWVLEAGEVAAPWVLFLDADEEATPAFWDEILPLTASQGGDLAGAFCCWKMMLRGRWLRRADNFPKWQLRLVHRDRIRFVDAGHGQKEGATEGRLVYVKEPYLHHAFSKGWSAWLDRHNRYSTLEAAERARSEARWRDLWAKPPSERNRLLKPLLSRIPGWPLLRFLHTYLLKGGLLEGREGFDYCFLMAFYEYLIRLKMRDAPKAPS